MQRTILFSCLASSMVSVIVTVLALTLGRPALVGAQEGRITVQRVAVTGADGAERVTLEAGPGIAGQVAVLGPDGAPRAYFSMGGGTGADPANVAFEARSEGGAHLARLGTIGAGNFGESNSGNLVLRDQQGHDRIRLLVADDGTPTISIVDETGATIWSAP